jgi:hypothetical protein
MGGRQNSLDAAAWHQIMDGLEPVTSITSLNGLDGVGGLFAGNQTEVLLGGKGLEEKEAVVAVARLLGRSRGTLTRLDLRYCAGVQGYESMRGMVACHGCTAHALALIPKVVSRQVICIGGTSEPQDRRTTGPYPIADWQRGSVNCSVARFAVIVLVPPLRGGGGRCHPPGPS